MPPVSSCQEPACVEGGQRFFGFHFGFQTSITLHHLPAPTGCSEPRKCSCWMLLNDAGYKIRRTENPRVGGSIPAPGHLT